jgi:hypothetical protein
MPEFLVIEEGMGCGEGQAEIKLGGGITQTETVI